MSRFVLSIAAKAQTPTSKLRRLKHCLKMQHNIKRGKKWKKAQNTDFIPAHNAPWLREKRIREEKMTLPLFVWSACVLFDAARLQKRKRNPSTHTRKQRPTLRKKNPYKREAMMMMIKRKRNAREQEQLRWDKNHLKDACESSVFGTSEKRRESSHTHHTP